MIYTAKGGIKRVVAVRMSPGENVMKGLEMVCADQRHYTVRYGQSGWL